MQDELENEIRELLRSGSKIAAVKLYRERTGSDLLTAKNAVEAIEAGADPVEHAMPDESDVVEQVVNLLSRGQKIEAIKVYRECYQVGLKEAKEAVERIQEEQRIPAVSGSGCLGILLLAAGVVSLWFR